MSAGTSEVLLQMRHVIAFASYVHFLLIKGQSDQMSKDPKILPAFREEKHRMELSALFCVQYFLWSLPFKFQVEPCAPKGKAQTKAGNHHHSDFEWISTM